MPAVAFAEKAATGGVRSRTVTQAVIVVLLLPKAFEAVRVTV